MSRFASLSLACAFALVMLAPSLYLLQFKVRQAYIAHELCVQREVVESMRTCHGECQLSKKFRALQREADSSFPAERLQLRTYPMVLHMPVRALLTRSAAARSFAEPSCRIEDGFVPDLEPVPWC